MSESSPAADRAPDLLLVEDNPGDARLVEEVVGSDQSTEELHVVSDGDEALDFVYQRGDHADAPLPNLVLLDWNLPGTDGEEVLTELKADSDLEHVPVVVITGSEFEREIAKAYQQQANACITKSGGSDAYMETLRLFRDFWLSCTRLPPPDPER